MRILHLHSPVPSVAKLKAPVGFDGLRNLCSSVIGEIVRRVEGLFALADQLELQLARARGQVDKLTPSLLARAFAGQLVPQDPTDEPAANLLERIKTKGKPHASR